ncbi:hypothetical protein LY76DRAFT_608598 [Colletotrichum caudatum]|nr:hypothetical protein LY76DRAFT_608598 [Colletotrichum caudatum]
MEYKIKRSPLCLCPSLLVIVLEISDRALKLLESLQRQDLIMFDLFSFNITMSDIIYAVVYEGAPFEMKAHNLQRPTIVDETDVIVRITTSPQRLNDDKSLSWKCHQPLTPVSLSTRHQEAASSDEVLIEHGSGLGSGCLSVPESSLRSAANSSQVSLMKQLWERIE